MSRLSTDSARRTLGVVALLFLSIGCASARMRGPEPTREMTGVVSRVIDGDTIVVGQGKRAVTVRLRCIDTPEIESRRRRGEPFGREAKSFAQRALQGRTVRLVYHRREPRDRYARLLAYVFLDDGRLFNADLVRGGYARTSRFKCNFRKQMKALEKEAQRARRGLWGL